MPKAGDHIVVHMVEPQPVGTQFERTRLNWPLHITLLGWFAGALAVDLDSGLSQIARTTAPISATVGEQLGFGPSGEVPVNIIAEQAQIRPLHSDLHAVVQGAGGVLASDQYVGNHFVAHITHHGAKRRHEGDVIAIDNFQLVTLLPNNICEVTTDFKLEGEQS